MSPPEFGRVAAAVKEAAVDVLVQRDYRIAAVRIALEGGSAGNKHVQVSVVVVIGEGGAIPIGFDNVIVSSLAAGVHERQADVRREFSKVGEILNGLRWRHNCGKRHKQTGPERMGAPFANGSARFPAYRWNVGCHYYSGAFMMSSASRVSR